MKTVISVILFFSAINSFASANPCEKNEAQGLMLIMDSISAQMVGTPIYSYDFMTKIFHTTKSGDTVLSVSGILHHANTPTSIHGLLECNSNSGEYEFAGAGTSSL